MWSSGELPDMLITVAVGAVLKFHLVERLFASRKVTLRTRQRGMLAFEWIQGRRVFLKAEPGRFKTIDAVAGRALDPARTLGELSSVRIGLVTVGALLKCQRLREISFGVALHTVHLGVFAEQRKFRPGMVKGAIQSGR